MLCDRVEDITPSEELLEGGGLRGFLQQLLTPGNEPRTVQLLHVDLLQI